VTRPAPASAPPPLTAERIAERLAALRPPRTLEVPGVRRAAVAAVLRFDRGRPETLLIRRAERSGDRWSGHVSFPGGREEDRDEDLLATAIRETREEVGLDLTRCARHLGTLPAVRAIARGRILPMTITPFVFHQLEPRPLALGDEAASSFWFPLDLAARGELDGRHEIRLGPVPLRLPCWRWDGHVVWGLTHDMLRALLSSVR
jgi:8-oxo-dGTP pyrophosphatase MutT (NUDIX family)